MSGTGGRGGEGGEQPTATGGDSGSAGSDGGGGSGGSEEPCRAFELSDPYQKPSNEVGAVVLEDPQWGTVSLDSEVFVDGDGEDSSSEVRRYVTWERAGSSARLDDYYCTDDSSGIDETWCEFEGAIFLPDGDLMISYSYRGGGDEEIGNISFSVWDDNQWQDAADEIRSHTDAMFAGPFLTADQELLVLVDIRLGNEPTVPVLPYRWSGEEWLPVTSPDGKHIDMSGAWVRTTESGEIVLTAREPDASPTQEPSIHFLVEEGTLTPIELCTGP